MAGISDLLSQALMGQKQQYYAEDPFFMAGQAALKYPVQYDPSDGKQALIMNLTQGLLGGGLSAFGKGRADDKFDSYMEPIKAGLEGGNLNEFLLTSGDPALFSAGVELDANQKAAAAERKQSLNDFIFKENAKAQIKGQYAKPARIGADEQPVNDPNVQGALQSILGKTMTPEQAAAISALSPKQQGAILTNISKAMELGGGDTSKGAVEAERDILNRLLGNEVTKRLQDVTPIYKHMGTLLPRDDRASDIAFIANFARILDPQSVVREGEVKIAEGASPLLQQWEGTLRSVATGGAKLPRQVREQMYAVVGGKINAFQSEYDNLATNLTAIGQRYGGNPINMLPLPISSTAQAAPAPAAAVPTSPGDYNDYMRLKAKYGR